MLAKVGSFTKGTSTGNQAITGVGFVPKLVLVWYSGGTTTDTWVDGWQAGIGYGDTTTAGSTFTRENDNATTSHRRRTLTAKFIKMINGSGTTLAEATLSSLDSDGFTINWSTNDSNTFIMNYLCLAGSDLTNVGVFNWKPAASPTTGNQSYSSLGFQPDLAIFASALNGGTFENTVSDNVMMVSAMQSTTARWAGMIKSDGNGAGSSFYNNKVLADHNTSGGADYFVGDFVSFNSNGLTINLTQNSWGQDLEVLTLKGGSYKVGSFTKSTSTGNQAVTGVGFVPAAVLFFTNSQTTANSNNTTSGARFGLGAADIAGNERSITGQNADGGGTTNTASMTSTTALLTVADNDTKTTNGQATLVSMDSDGFTINWGTNDSNADYIGYVAFGPGNTAPTFSSQPSVSYNSGLTRTSVDNTPISINFTANDAEQQSSNALSYEIRTSATPGAGSLVGSGTCTHNSAKSHSTAYNATGLSVGSNTLYVHVTDGTFTTTSNSFTLLRDDGTAPTYSVTPSVTTNPVIFGQTYALAFTASDTYSTAGSELTWQLRTGTSGGGTLVQSGTATSGASNTPTITDSSLNPGSLTRYFRIRDGGGTWSGDTTLNISAKLVDSGVVAGGETATKLITLQSTSTYSVTFTATDAASTNSNEMYYEIRTASSGGGTLLTSGGPFTSGATVTTASFNDTTLANGSNTRYLRVRDGAANWSDFSFNVEANLITAQTGSDSGTVAGAESYVMNQDLTDTGAVAGAETSYLYQAESDSGAVTGAESAVVGLSDSDSGVVAGAETDYINIPDTDSGTVTAASETDGVVTVDAFSQSDSGTVSGAESESVFETIVKTGTDSGTVAGAESSSLVETERYVTDTDLVTVYGLEDFDLTAGYTVSDSGVVAGAESESIITIIFPGVQDAGVVAGAESATVLLVITANAEINIENPVQIAEEASDQYFDVVLYPNSANIDDALEGRYGPRREQNRMYLVDKNGFRYTDITNKILQGNITVNRNEQVSRSGSFVFKDLDGINLVTQYLMPVYILTINGIDVEFEQGIFEGTVPGRSYTEKHSDISVIANDLSIIVVKNKFTYPYTVGAGSNYVDAVRAVANLAGITNINIPPTTHETPNDFTWSPETSYMVALNDLLQGINYLPAYFNRKGQLTSRPRSYLSERTPDVTYTTLDNTLGTKIVVEPFDTSFNQSELKNQTVIQVNDPLRDPFWSTYYIENPISPIVLPIRYAMSGWSTSSYLYAPYHADPAGLLHELPHFPNENFPFSAAVSFGGWVYLNDTDTNKQVGGMWEGSTNKSFLLRSAGATSGLPEFVVSGNGTTETVIGVPIGQQPQDGWHHLMGVFNPGGLLSANLVTNGGFQEGLQAPGSNWTKDLAGLLPSVLTLNASNPGSTADFPTNTRSLDIASTASNTNQTLTIYQDVKAGFVPGHKISVDYRRYFYGKTATNGSVAFTIKALDVDLNVLATMFTATATSTEGGWTSSSPTLSSIDVPAGTVILRIYIQHFSNSSASGTINCRWDNITIKDALAGELSIYVDGALADTTATSLPAGIFQGTSKMRIGYTGYPGTDGAHTGMMTGMALYYGALTAADVAQLYDGLWPTNVPFCMAYWHFDSETNQPLEDETARGHTLLPVPGHALNYKVSAGILKTGLGDRDRFKAIPDVINFPRVKDQTQADLLARIIAEDNSSQYLLGTLNTTLDPRRDLNEVYQIYISDAQGNVITDRKWMVDGWSAELRTAGRMSHQIRRVESF